LFDVRLTVLQDLQEAEIPLGYTAMNRCWKFYEERRESEKVMTAVLAVGVTCYRPGCDRFVIPNAAVKQCSEFRHNL
jgi:hypothetical protein